MKVSELSGVLLDYWAAKADGRQVQLRRAGRRYLVADGVMTNVFVDYVHDLSGGLKRCRFSADWAQGGPIIEREYIEITNERGYLSTGAFGRSWEAQIASTGWVEGDTPLVAAMRAYVASKYGNEVPDEVDE